MEFEGFPLIVGWELTLACDLRCRHCGSSAGEPRPDELTTVEVLKICDQLPALLVQEVDFTGGEPLLRPDWAEIARYLVGMGITVNLLTNGLNLDVATIARMKEVGISGVGISLDGLEQTHDRIRNHPGSFQSVMRSINLMQQQSLLFNVITTVNSLNLPELPLMKQLLRSANVRFWRLQPIIPTGRVRTFSRLELDDQGIHQLGTFIRLHYAVPNSADLRIICGDGLEYIEGTQDIDRPWRGCSAGITACGITSNGKVKGCLSMPDDLIEGDLRKQDLWDIWFHPDTFKYSRHFSLERLGENCKQCDRAEECKGGCSANSYTATGTFHNDPFCYYRLSTTERETR